MYRLVHGVRSSIPGRRKAINGDLVLMQLIGEYTVYIYSISESLLIAVTMILFQEKGMSLCLLLGNAEEVLRGGDVGRDGK